MSDLFSWFSWGAFIQTIRPDVIWMFSRGNLLPYCIVVFIIIFLIIYGISKKFFIKRPFKIKNYISMILLAIIVYYLLWVILLNIFALSLGLVSQYL